MVAMAVGEAARIARDDQAWAAQSEVVGILGLVERERTGWSRLDEPTHRRIERLLGDLAAVDSDRTRVCEHANGAAFARAPRPLVLDTVREILACWEGCYWLRVGWGIPTRWPDTVRCFDCGCDVGRFVGHDLFIAYGPILVVGVLCATCQEPPSTGHAHSEA
jgi:hypothetical protein